MGWRWPSPSAEPFFRTVIYLPKETLELCRRLWLHKDTDSISIALGATINMAAAHS